MPKLVKCKNCGLREFEVYNNGLLVCENCGQFFYVKVNKLTSTNTTNTAIALCKEIHSKMLSIPNTNCYRVEFCSNVKEDLEKIAQQR